MKEQQEQQDFLQNNNLNKQKDSELIKGNKFKEQQQKQIHISAPSLKKDLLILFQILIIIVLSFFLLYISYKIYAQINKMKADKIKTNIQTINNQNNRFNLNENNQGLQIKNNIETKQYSQTANNDVLNLKTEISKSKQEENNIDNKQKIQLSSHKQFQLQKSIISSRKQQKNEQKNPQQSNPLIPNYYLTEQQIKKRQYQTTKLPIVHDKSQLFDPVLKTIFQARKRTKGHFRQTIYSMRNTKITYDQYLRARNLIQITKYWNVKDKNIKMDMNKQDDCQVNSVKVTCEQKQKYLQLLIEEEKQYYLKKYPTINNYSKNQLPFCIIVPSYKNFKNDNYKRNINSILMQQYQNFHVVYVDDFSNDGTKQAVQQYIKVNQINENKFKFISNNQNKKALYNIYNSAHNQCQEKQIMIIVDGDDYLIGTQVLKFLNFQYQTKKILCAYTNYLRIHEPYYLKVGTSLPYRKSILDGSLFRRRSKQFSASHLRSYFVDLFRKIKIQDLQDNKGQFFTAANDFAIMMPILQMATPHIQYLPEITYLYDSGTGQNNFQTKVGKQSQNAEMIKKRSKYRKVNFNEINPKLQQNPNKVQTNQNLNFDKKL